MVKISSIVRRSGFSLNRGHNSGTSCSFFITKTSVPPFSPYRVLVPQTMKYKRHCSVLVLYFVIFCLLQWNQWWSDLWSTFRQSLKKLRIVVWESNSYKPVKATNDVNKAEKKSRPTQFLVSSFFIFCPIYCFQAIKSVIFCSQGHNGGSGD